MVAALVALGLMAPIGATAATITLGQAASDSSTECSDLLAFNVVTAVGGQCELRISPRQTTLRGAAQSKALGSTRIT